MLVPGLAPKRREIKSLEGAILGRCHPLEMMSQPLECHCQARWSRCCYSTSWCHQQGAAELGVTTLPTSLDFWGGCMVLEGGSSSAALGLKAGISSMPPGEQLWCPPRHSQLWGGLCLSQAEVWGGSQGIPKSLPQPVLGSGNSTGGAPSSQGVQKLPTSGQKEAGLSPWCPRRLEGHPGVEGDGRGRGQGTVWCPRGGGRAGGLSAAAVVAVPKRPRPRWPCSSGGSSWP